MPGNPWRYFHHDRAMSRGDGGFETVGLARDVVDPFVGLWGVALSPRGEGSARLEASFAGAEVAVLAPAGEGCLSVEVDGVTAFGGDVGEAVDGASTPCARVDGSVRAWSRRGLAARDLVHSSRGGYEKVAEGLVDRLLRAYDAYRRAEAKR